MNIFNGNLLQTCIKQLCGRDMPDGGRITAAGEQRAILYLIKKTKIKK